MSSTIGAISEKKYDFQSICLCSVPNPAKGNYVFSAIIDNSSKKKKKRKENSSSVKSWIQIKCIDKANSHFKSSVEKMKRKVKTEKSKTCAYRCSN